jgi:gamma-glutamyltranspeptidase/glutathione hydrolase
LHEIPPNGQGIAALMALGSCAISMCPLGPSTASTPSTVQIEAMKLAFADTYRYVSDPAGLEFPCERLLDDAYLRSRATLIDMKRAQPFAPGNPVKGGTIYLSAADENGMMVSFIQSNYMGFGSGIVVPSGASRCRTGATASAFDPVARIS